jgi:hypothetical protein
MPTEPVTANILEGTEKTCKMCQYSRLNMGHWKHQLPVPIVNVTIYRKASQVPAFCEVLWDFLGPVSLIPTGSETVSPLRVERTDSLCADIPDSNSIKKR